MDGRSTALKRKGILLALATVAVLAIGVTVAMAAKSYSTQIKLEGVSGTPSVATLYGHLETNSKCLGPRLLQAEKQTSSGFKVVDQDFSSANGAYAFRGNIGPLPATIRILAAKTKLKNNRGDVTTVCKPGALQFTVGPAKLAGR